MLRAGVTALLPGVARLGALDAESAAAMLHFAEQSGIPVAAVQPNQFWTNAYIGAALR